MSIDAISNVVNAISSALSSVKGLGDVLVYVGVAVLLVIGIIGLTLLSIRLLKNVLRLSPTSFIVFITVFAAILVVIGALLP